MLVWIKEGHTQNNRYPREWLKIVRTGTLWMWREGGRELNGGIREGDIEEGEKTVIILRKNNGITVTEGKIGEGGT